MALTTVLLAGLLPFTQAAVQNYRLTNTRLHLVQQAGYALHMVIRDLRTADPLTVTIGSSHDLVTFQSRNYLITYLRGDLPILYRNLNNGAGAQPVTDPAQAALSSLIFSYRRDQRLVDITMTVSETVTGQSLTLVTSVYLEN